ncbi:MAG: zinc-ribbon and FHA domain-containing protein [Actinomycetota bacterium]|nr:zinc-ribbon and FHA domain-containing protein [Actinomycetota bacterium]
MADAFCNNCGHRNTAGSNFCSSCGHALGQADEPTTITFQSIDPGDLAEDQVVTVPEMPDGGGLLWVKRGPNAGSKYALDKSTVQAGRHPDSDIFLDDITVSRRHAEFTRTDDGYVVRDVGSLNGTYLNRDRIEESPLENGDEVQIGKFKLVFLSSSNELGQPSP